MIKLYILNNTQMMFILEIIISPYDVHLTLEINDTRRGNWERRPKDRLKSSVRGLIEKIALHKSTVWCHPSDRWDYYFHRNSPRDWLVLRRQEFLIPRECFLNQNHNVPKKIKKELIHTVDLFKGPFTRSDFAGSQNTDRVNTFKVSIRQSDPSISKIGWK